MVPPDDTLGLQPQTPWGIQPNLQGFLQNSRKISLKSGFLATITIIFCILF
jgi:hypothetical protein